MILTAITWARWPSCHHVRGGQGGGPDLPLHRGGPGLRAGDGARVSIFWLVDTRDVAWIMAAMILGIGFASIRRPGGHHAHPAVPGHVRYSAIAMRANFAGVIAGFTPALAARILGVTGGGSTGPALPPTPLGVISLVSSIAARRLIRRDEEAERGRTSGDLRTGDPGGNENQTLQGRTPQPHRGQCCGAVTRRAVPPRAAGRGFARTASSPSWGLPRGTTPHGTTRRWWTGRAVPHAGLIRDARAPGLYARLALSGGLPACRHSASGRRRHGDREAAQGTEAGKWAVGRGYDEHPDGRRWASPRGPGQGRPGVPAYLESRAHMALVNTAALERTGITRTPRIFRRVHRAG
ncbi:hypothetical protein QJS66_13380 [Kocuria rhizophila]|nr:hypothetical protein QJS66_13380 [Kocuria rhizophila]